MGGGMYSPGSGCISLVLCLLIGATILGMFVSCVGGLPERPKLVTIESTPACGSQCKIPTPGPGMDDVKIVTGPVATPFSFTAFCKDSPAAPACP